MSNETAEAARYYLDVCAEHGRRFPLRNILVAVPAYQASADKDAFVNAVNVILTALAILDRAPDVEPDTGDEVNSAGD